MDAAKVLEFWFGQDRKRWFVKDAAFDADIRQRFSGLYELGMDRKLEGWKSRPRDCLALVILFDQFPRNMFRDTARAFASDPLAREAAHVILKNAWDAAYTEDERTFAYLPFEHSESLEDQELSMRLFQGNENLEWARKHREIIRRFGRFPHRNAALGRQSTPEEIEFLKQPGSSF